MAQVVQRGRGGTVYLDVVDEPPYLPASAPAPSVTLYDPSGRSVLVTSQAATAGARTTVGAAGVAAGATAIPVVSAAGFVIDTRILIGPNAAGQWEWCMVEGVNTAAKTITVADALEHAYASGAVIGSPRLSVSVSAAQAAEYNRDCQARWVFTVNGQAREQTSLFSISYWSPRCPATRMDILDRDALIENRISTRQKVRRLIQIAWDEVLEEMATHLDPAAVVSGGSLIHATCWKTLELVGPPNDQQEERDRYHAEYRAALDRVLASKPIDVSADGYLDDDKDIVSASSMVGRVYRA